MLPELNHSLSSQEENNPEDDRFFEDFQHALLGLGVFQEKTPQEMNTAQAFSRHLRAIRSISGMTRATLAENSGLNHARIIVLESILIKPSCVTQDDLTRLSKALGGNKPEDVKETLQLLLNTS